MKENRSLAISTTIQQCKAGNILGVLEKEFPAHVLEKHITEEKMRNRVFTPVNTLLTMLLTAVQEDKTLKNSVDLYYIIHQKHKEMVLKEMENVLQKERESDLQKDKTAGRPKKYAPRLSKSLNKDISLNTAAYSKARDRVPAELVQTLFSATRIEQPKNNYSHWHGYRVMQGDGTYLQMQDTESLKQEYDVKIKGKSSESYPQGLLEVITERGTGQVHSFRLASRHTSELELFYDMINELPSGSLLLLDALYDCYPLFLKCRQKGIEMVVAAKRKRNYEVVETLSAGDEIIRVKAPFNRSGWLPEYEKSEPLLLRRITCKSPDGKEYILYCTILNRKIDKEEIQLLYLTRWDIEIGIREIKTIMDINILRSKTPEMALKELTVSLAAYNLIRKVIYASIKGLPFSPKGNFIHQFYTLNKDLLIDKKGRVYNKWSTGRRRTGASDSKTTAAKKKA